MYNFFYYFIRYTLVRNLNKLFKPKTLLIIIIVLLVFLLLRINTYAFYEGNNTYSDPNTQVVFAYNSILNDFLVDLDELKDDTYYQDVINCLKYKNYGYYVFYGVYNGESVINGNTVNRSNYYIVFYDLANPTTNTTQYDNYLGINNVYINEIRVIRTYTITNQGITENTSSHDVYIPYILYNYNSDLVTEYLININNNNNDVLSSIDNTISQQNEYLQSEPDYDNFSDSDLPSSDITNPTTDGINNIFTLFYNSMTREPTSDDNIYVPIPFTDSGFEIPYNYTSTYCPTIIKNIIIMFWYFIGGVFIVKDVASKIRGLKSGNIENIQNSNIKEDLL